MHWYYEQRGAQIGPLTEEQFGQAVAGGQVTRDTLVWNESLTGWTQYKTLIAKPPAIPSVQAMQFPSSMKVCSQCSRNFPEQDLIQYGGLWICGACKPAFFQRLKEEGRVSAIWRDGKLLVAASDTVLPDRCVKCNAPAAGVKMTKKFYWHPPAFYLLICAGVLIYAIVALIVRKKSVIHMGICPEHKKRRARSVAITWVAVGVSIATIIAAAATETGALAFIGIFLLLGAMIYGIIATQLVVPTRIDQHSVVWLKGVSPAYLENLPVYKPY
jgi:hypothetical protein